MADKTIASRAGVGGIAVLGAKIFFILSGLAQQALLPRFIGKAGWGALSLVLAPSNIVNNVIVSGSTQAASRAVAGAPGHEAQAHRAALKVHVPVALACGAAFAAAALPIAWFEHAPHIVAPLFMMSAVLLFYGLYAPLVGTLNGRGLFVRQAFLDVLFATLRTLGMLGAGWLFIQRGLSGALGSTTGFALAAFVIGLVAVGLAGTGASGAGGGNVLRGMPYLAVLMPLALAQLFTNVLMQLDIILLGRFLSERAPVSWAYDDETVVFDWVAAYRACQLFAFLPYQMLLSITQVLFPMLARAKTEGGADVREYVSRGARLAAIVGGAMVAVIAAMPETALRFAYDADIGARGAATLRVLALGQGAFAMLGIGCTVLSSLGRERTSAILTFGASVVTAAACALIVPRQTFGDGQLRATGACMAISLAVALAICAVLVVREARAFVPWPTAARVLLALGLTVAVGTRIPATTRLFAPVIAVALAAVYGFVLLATREVGTADLRWIRSALRRASPS